MKNLFKIDIFTYLLLILSFFAGYIREMIIVYIILFIHELGHFFLMKHYNIKIHNITMYPYGGIIKSDILINTNSRNVILISLGGIISQIILLIIVYFIYKTNIITDTSYNIFLKYNTSIIIFNLLPIYPLDGFKILNSILELFINFKFSIQISLIINIISLILFFCYLYYNNINNYIIIIFMIFSLLKYIKNIKYIINKFYIERSIYNIKYNGLKSIDNIDKLYKNNLNYINGINEKDYLNKKYSHYL